MPGYDICMSWRAGKNEYPQAVLGSNQIVDTSPQRFDYSQAELGATRCHVHRPGNCFNEDAALNEGAALNEE